MVPGVIASPHHHHGLCVSIPQAAVLSCGTLTNKLCERQGMHEKSSQISVYKDSGPNRPIPDDRPGEDLDD
jgi:hypothetical protein